MLPKFAEKDMECYKWKHNYPGPCRLICDSYEPFEFFGKEPASDLEKFSLQFLSDQDKPSPQMPMDDRSLFEYLKQASSGRYGSDRANYDFTYVLMKAVGFEEFGAVLCPRYKIPYTSGKDACYYIQTDICLVKGDMTLMPIIQEPADAFDRDIAEAKIVSAAIAAFLNNNNVRRELGYAALKDAIIPCICMQKTKPTFYIVSVTKSMSEYALTGKLPRKAIHFKKCAVRHPTTCSMHVGMRLPRYRKIALQHLDAFKDLVKDHWEKFVVTRRHKRIRTRSLDSFTDHSSD